ncbi:MAG: hypothetical protein HQL45_15720 [Alphaproteobacteria bacterium]|nr:hypothetical protein [Alphaproteobacteria bacterium]
MAEAFAVFVVLAGLIAIPASLINPKLILRKMEDPKRWQALGTVLATWLALLIFAGTLLPKPETTSSTPASPSINVPVEKSATSPAPAPKGIGASAANLEGIFKAAGYETHHGIGQDGEPRVLGANGYGVFELIGDASNVHTFEYRLVKLKKGKQSAMEELVLLAAVSAVIFPDWKEGGDWMAAALTKGGQTVYKGRRVLMGWPKNEGFQFKVTVEP